MKFSKSIYYDRNDTKNKTPLEKIPTSSIEIDLHSFTPGYALAYFISYYNDNVESEGIKVIHGYHSGDEIRRHLRTYLGWHSNYLLFRRGEEICNNEGITFVYPKRRLPPIAESIGNKIFEYCMPAKSEEKILGEFRLFGDREVKRSIKSLLKKGKLRLKEKGKIRLYEAVNL